MYKVTHTECREFAPGTETTLLGIYATLGEARAAATETGLECRIANYTLTPTEQARAAKLAQFGIAYTPATAESNAGWGKPAPAAPAAPAAERVDRTAKLLAMNESALVAELAKKKPDASEVARLRANIEKLKG